MYQYWQLCHGKQINPRSTVLSDFFFFQENVAFSKTSFDMISQKELDFLFCYFEKTFESCLMKVE